jgi:hypothetical protein
MSETASLLPLPRQVFYNSLGQPLAGGLVYTYVPNSLTQKTTWQDSGEVNANANPIVLDSVGSALIYGSGNYQITVTDSLGNAVPAYSGLTVSFPVVSAAMAPVVAASSVSQGFNLLAANGGTVGIELQVAGNASIGGTLAVTGAASIGAATTGGNAPQWDQVLCGNTGTVAAQYNAPARAAGTLYTNALVKPIDVKAGFYNTSTDSVGQVINISGTVAGKTVWQDNIIVPFDTLGFYAPLGFIVPAGATYEINASSSLSLALGFWWELS